MDGAAGEVPDQPAVDRADAKVLRVLIGGQMIKQPANLRCREKRIERQAGQRQDFLFMPLVTQPLAGIGRTPALPG